MAVMQDTDRADLFADIMRGLIPVAGLTKAQLRAAVDAADQWASDNAAAFNAALPPAARNALTSSQKSRLLALVAIKRYERGA